MFAGSTAVEAAGHRALQDVFGTDLAAGLNDDASLGGVRLGVRIVQSDRPDLVLRDLDRGAAARAVSARRRSRSRRAARRGAS